MADNVIKAVFASGRRVKTVPLWRYDHGIRLQPIGLELPESYEMHFSNSKTGEAKTQLADASGAVIPAEYLIPGTEVYAWIYLVGDNYGRTKAEIIIPIDAKAKPIDQEPTPEQQPVIEQAIDALNDAQDALEEAASHIIESGITPEERAKLAGIEAGAEVNVIEEVRYFDVLRQEYRPLRVTNKGVNLPRNEIVPENNNDVVYVDFEIDADGNVTLSPFVEPIIDAVNVHGQTVIARVKISNDSQPDFLPLIHLDGYNIRFAGFTAAEEKLDIWYDLIQHRWRAQFKELVDLDSADNSYVWANQGSENSGKVLTVGSDGAVSPQEVAGGQHIWWTDELTVSSPSAKSASVAYSLLHGPVTASSSTVSAGDYVIGPPFPENPQYGEEIIGDPLWLYVVTLAGSGSSCSLKARVLVPEAVDMSAYRTADDQDAIDYQLGQAILGKLDTTGNAYRSVSIPMGQLDSTSTSTVMTAQVDGITELRDGVCVWLQNGVVASASGVTLNVNSLGAKPIYNSMTGAVVTTTFTAASTYLFVYNATRVSGGCWDMVYGYDTNTTYTPVKLGFGYTSCVDAEANTAKGAALSSYTLTTGGFVTVRFTYAVPAGATLNINNKGAKPIFYRGEAITAGVIKAGDIVTFCYSSQYHIVSIIPAVDETELPAVNSGDNGKILMVVDGAWAAGSISSATGVSF